MRGVIPPLPNASSWRGALTTYLYFILLYFTFMVASTHAPAITSRSVDTETHTHKICACMDKAQNTGIKDEHYSRLRSPFCKNTNLSA
jgi:hypothetical protein